MNLRYSIALIGALALTTNLALADMHAKADVVVDDDGRAEFEAVRGQVKANRQALVAENLPLTAVAADNFWPLYREFHVERDILADRRIKGLQEFYDNFDTLSDDQAKQLLDDYVDLQDDKLELQKKYMAKFRDVLTEKQVLRYFQIEHRLDAIIEDELVQVLPLAE
jgi:Spy/CpxP family protein refolding chaperone